ncbi:hypothetical protein F5Y12DRAFT_717992 [Xylaria sp. FL1777]|nr:hypothetical protein F5Y12DRAFT_717992 [Xylaria sp. FL1777]
MPLDATLEASISHTVSQSDPCLSLIVVARPDPSAAMTLQSFVTPNRVGRRQNTSFSVPDPPFPFSPLVASVYKGHHQSLSLGLVLYDLVATHRAVTFNILFPLYSASRVWKDSAVFLVHHFRFIHCWFRPFIHSFVLWVIYFIGVGSEALQADLEDRRTRRRAEDTHPSFEHRFTSLTLTIGYLVCGGHPINPNRLTPIVSQVDNNFGFLRR